VFDMFRTVINYLDKNPVLDAFSQVLLTILVGLGPIAALSWLRPAADKTGNILWLKEFVSYFKSGELVLPIFAVVGSLLFLTFTRFGRMSSLRGLVMVLVIFGSLLTTALVLGDNPGFENDLETRILSLLWVIYLMVNAAWVFLLWISRSPPPAPLPGAEQEQKQAQALAREARG